MQPLKLYYLDDETELLEVFKDLFESEQIEITTFSDPKSAMQMIQSSPPDLLFLDYRLPGITGDEIALKLDSKIPKILVTGEIAVKCKANFESIISKPFSVESILPIIENHLKAKNAA